MNTSLGWIGIIIVGLLAGWAAASVTGVKERMGCLLYIAVGVVGAVIGAWIFRELALDAPGGRYLSSFVIAFVGATALLLVVRLLTGRRGD